MLQREAGDANAGLASADKDSRHFVLGLSQQAEADNSIIEMQDELNFAQQRVVELSLEVVELRQKVSCVFLLYSGTGCAVKASKHCETNAEALIKDAAGCISSSLHKGCQADFVL